MAILNVTIDDRILDDTYRISLHDDRPIKQIINELISYSCLPRCGFNLRRLNYKLIRHQTGKRLRATATLRQAGIVEDEILRLICPRARRVWRIVHKLLEQIREELIDQVTGDIKEKIMKRAWNRITRKLAAIEKTQTGGSHMQEIRHLVKRAGGDNIFKATSILEKWIGFIEINIPASGIVLPAVAVVILAVIAVAAAILSRNQHENSRGAPPPLFTEEVTTDAPDDDPLESETAPPPSSPERPRQNPSIGPVPPADQIAFSAGCGNGLLEGNETCESEQAAAALCAGGYQQELDALQTQWPRILVRNVSDDDSDDPYCDGQTRIAAIALTDAAFESCTIIASLPVERLPDEMAAFHPSNLRRYPYYEGEGSSGVADLGGGEITIEFATDQIATMADAEVRDCVLAISAEHLFAELAVVETGGDVTVWCEAENPSDPVWHSESAEALKDFIDEVEQTCEDDLTCGPNADCRVDRCRCVERPAEYVAACGNGILDAGEGCESDAGCALGSICTTSCQCATLCGDGTCQPNRGETASSCGQDCAAVCGDGAITHDEFCDSDSGCPTGQICINCASCELPCGNGTCQASQGEDASTCPEDCHAVCGDGAITHTEVCDGPLGCAAGQVCNNCASCGAVCGNGTCEVSSGEAAWNCPQDCPHDCGDGAITHTEICETDADCGGVGIHCQNCLTCASVCGDDICAVGENCPADCYTPTWQPVCGDGDCNSKTEWAFTCPQDCGQVCGDDHITHTEVCETGADCGGAGWYCNSCVSCETHCGDGIVAGAEACEDDSQCTNSGLIHEYCTDSCTCTVYTSGPGPVLGSCGDYRCDPGETAANCPSDCKCGNGVCDSGEDGGTCPADCPALCQDC